MISEQELLRKKKLVDNAKQNVATLNGQIQAHEKQLKDAWGHKTVEGAQKDIQLRDKKIAKYEQQIEEGCEELEKFNIE